MGWMMTDLYLRTSIRPQAEKKTFKNSCKALIGAASVIAGSELLLPALEFAPFGIYAYLLGSSVLGLGLLARQKLRSFKKHPYMIHATDESLTLSQDNTPLFTINWDQIESFQYIDTGNQYGLAFTLKSPLKGISEKCRKEYGVDLFLPYFSHATYLLLEKWHNEKVLAD